MKTFNQSADEFLSTMDEMIQNISKHLATMPDDESFNVKNFSEAYAAATGFDELAIAGIIRSVVRGSEEFKNVRGRSGGVKRTELAQKLRDTTVENSNATETADVPVTEEVAVVAEPVQEPVVESAPSSEAAEDFFGFNETADEVAA